MKSVIIILFYSIQAPVIRKQAAKKTNLTMSKDFLDIITVVESSQGVWFPRSRNNLELQHVSQGKNKNPKSA